MGQQISIKQIAELAGVNYATVSRALRGQGRMSQNTRDRIVQIAREQGYTPSLIARTLVSRRSFAIGLVVTAISDPFNSAIAQGIESEAQTRGYGVLISSAPPYDGEREIEIVKSFQGHQVDGIIVASGRAGNRYASLFKETRVPIVLINSHAAGINVHSISHNDYGGGRVLLKHLIEKGYQQIAYVGNDSAGKVQEARTKAWRDTIQLHDMPSDLNVNRKDSRYIDGAECAEQLLSEHGERIRAKRTAIWCFNDRMAVGAMSVIQERGIRVPDEIGIAGFDDLEVAPYITPKLTTWHQPRMEMGQRAGQMLFDLIEAKHKTGDRLTSRNEMLDGHLEARQSA
jgi:DNA-binding LacI/PurR family transcriptional regulator